jgi:hypothetical protein
VTTHPPIVLTIAAADHARRLGEWSCLYARRFRYENAQDAEAAVDHLMDRSRRRPLTFTEACAVVWNRAEERERQYSHDTGAERRTRPRP